MTPLEARLTAEGPKRILALDGGGIRGALSLGFLVKMEELLRDRHGRKNLRLSDYFDLIGGTSTGAIIAAGLSIGMSASTIRDRYLALGGKVFGKKKWRRWQATFSEKPLEEELKTLFKDRTLGDPSLETGLCIVAKRADTGSTWPLINHPGAKYYGSNAGILLRDAIRASTAAPTYFVPEKVDVGAGQIGAFVDGGVSMANNPALQLFLVATLKGFPFQWPTGEDRLLLVSIGTGIWRRQDNVDDVVRGKLWDWAKQVPTMLMEDASWQAQLLLQYLSSSRRPWKIDREIGDLKDDLLTPKPALSYTRYDVWLEKNELQSLGLVDIADKVESLREMSAAENRQDLAEIGIKGAESQVAERDFPPAFDLPREVLDALDGDR